MTEIEPLFAEFGNAPPAKRAILDQSLKLFASRGVASVSIRDIAAATGFTNPALFRHFAGKEDLARVLFEVCYRRLSAVLGAPAAMASLQSWLTAALREVEERPEAFHYVVENVRQRWATLPLELRSQNIPALARKMIESDQAAGRIRPDVDPKVAAVIVVGAIMQHARLAHVNGALMDPGAAAEILAKHLLRGFGV
jgi:AcrR family transcriptional regulator